MVGPRRAHALVSGTVRGVYFRATTRDTAREHGVDGWVRTLEDGRVEAVFGGQPEAVERLVALRRDGAPDTPRARRAVREQPEVSTGSACDWSRGTFSLRPLVPRS